MNDRSSASRMRAIGITQRSTPLDCAWTGELRLRFTDFQVNEISESGEVVHLKTIGSNEEQPDATDESNAGDTKSEGQAASKGDAVDAPNGTQDAPSAATQAKAEDVSAHDIAALSKLAGDKFVQEVVYMYQHAQDPEVQKQKATAEPTDDRSKRGQIHQEVRRIFRSKIDTGTNDAGVIVASLVMRKGNKRGRGGRNNRNNNKQEEKPAGTGEHLHFTMYKDNRDTMDAVNQIGRMLRVKSQSIGYAGTKDRRASTTQRCSVRYIRPRALAGTNGKLRGIVTGDYEYSKHPIRLGQLKGNEFVITIKECQLAEESEARSAAERLQALQPRVQSALDHMAQHGWINYFGHQRFGTHGIGTHEIGKLILGEKYEEAVNSLLAYDPEMAEKAERGELPDEASTRDELQRSQACMLFVTEKDQEKANQVIPRRFTAEVCLLRHLTRAGSNSRRDFVGAIVHITRGLRTMYMHAYQSHVWNHAASRRWELYGDKVVKGDLVLARAETDKGPEVDQDGGDVVNPTEDLDEDEFAQHARALTEEEAASGRFTINDVVLPSPGYEVIYPDNEIGAFYSEFMARPENGGLDPHKMRRIRREFSLPGRYRRFMNHFLSKPSIDFRTYVDDTEQMHPTDLDLIRAEKTKNKRKGEDQSEGPATKKNKSEPQQTKEGGEDVTMDTNDQEQTKDTDVAQDGGLQTAAVVTEKVAAVVKFQLGSSAYATVTLRELMGDPPEDTTAGDGGTS